MKRAFGAIAVLALFFAVLPFVRAESNDPAKVTAATSSEPTKWDVLNAIQQGGLQQGETREVSFSENEINEFIDRKLDAFNKKWFVDKASVKLNDGDMDVVLHVLRPIPGNLEFNTSIEVVDGVAVPVINSAWYGYFPAPASFVERIGNFIMKKKSAADWFALPSGQWDSVSIKNDSLSFVVSRSNDK